MSNSIKIFAPASVSNLACGFDVMGFALEQPGDEIIIEVDKSQSEPKIETITGDEKKLSYNLEENTAGMAILKIAQKYPDVNYAKITINKKMGIGSGIGSSAASASGAVFAVNQLFDLKLELNDLIEFAMLGEAVASGTIHADNVAPSLLGGFTLIRGYDPVDIVKINTPLDLYCNIIYPAITIKTSDARKILPESIPLKTAIKQWGNVGGMIAGLITGDAELISRSMTDLVAEPVRAPLIPYYYDLKQAAADTGAIGCNISGSGPSVFALSQNKETAGNIEKNMCKVLDNAGIKYQTYISKINNTGPIILS